MKVTIAIFAVAAILATTVVISTTTQHAYADKVGPKPGENRVGQGGLGEYFSSEGREAYGGTKGPGHGETTSTYARPDTTGGTCDITAVQCSHESYGVGSLGDNFAFYASGECHRTPCE